MEDLDMYYSSSFSKGYYEKWQTLMLIHLEVTIGLKSQLTNIFLSLWLPQEDQLGNQSEGMNMNKKHHSDEKVRELKS